MGDAITQFPTPLPSRSVPATWAATFESNFLDHLNTFISEMNLFAAALNTFSTYSTSSTSLAVGTGTKNLTVDTGKSYQKGNPVIIAYTTTPAIWMYGTVSSYTSGTGALEVEVSLINGSGTYTAWTVTLCGPAVNSQYIYRDVRTSNTVLGTADRAKFHDITSGTFSQTYSAAATLGDGWLHYIRNSGTGVITLDPDGSEQIDGATTLVLYPGEARLVICNGTAFYTVLYANITNSEVVVHTGNGYGSTNNKIRRFTTAMTNVGTAITYADSAGNGGSFIINESGQYEITYSDKRAGSSYFGISKNSAELTTTVESITVASRLAITMVTTTLTLNQLSATVRLAAGDVIRAHTDGLIDGTDDKTFFSIRKISS